MIRQTTKRDILEIEKIDKEAFGKGGITKKMVESQLEVFPDGALVSVIRNQIAGVVFCERHNQQKFPIYIHDVSQTHEDKGKLFYLSVITVRQDFRGKGIGSSLLKAVDELAKKLEVTKIYCPVNKKHPYLKKGVLQFWMKNDFRIVGETKWEVSPDRFLDSFIFEKSLKKSSWEKYYQETLLEKIPWQKTQASYFTKVIESGKVKPCTVLDLGCGTGAKAIYLAKRGFRVTGVDISETAITLAKEDAKKTRARVKFFVADATNLSFLGDKKFDFILDWANLHGIPKDKRNRYVEGVINHTKIGGKLLLRCFSKHGVKKEFVRRPMGTIYFFSKENIKKLFGKHFKILEANKSRPFVGKKKEPPAKWLDEYLMEKL